MLFFVPYLSYNGSVKGLTITSIYFYARIKDCQPIFHYCIRFCRLSLTFMSLNRLNRNVNRFVAFTIFSWRTPFMNAVSIDVSKGKSTIVACDRLEKLLFPHSMCFTIQRNLGSSSHSLKVRR